MKTDRENGRFPWAVGAGIIAVFVASVLERGYYTWPFNSLAYLPSGWGLVFTAGCVLLLVLAGFFRSRLEAIKPAAIFQVLFFTGMIAVFVRVIVAAAPVFPSYYGDGYIYPYTSYVRLRYDLLRVVRDYLQPWNAARPYYSFYSLEYTMTDVSVLSGVIYILISLFLVLKTRVSFFGRLSGMVFFAASPAVINFTGHWDSYSILVVFLTAFLSLVFFARERKSFLIGLCALPVLILAVWEKHLAAVALLYPLGWMYFLELERRSLKKERRALVSAVVLAGVLSASLIAILGRIPFSAAGKSFGGYFSQMLASGGMLVAFYHPLHTIIPAVVPLGMLSVFLLFSRAARRSLVGAPARLAAFWVSIVIAAVYYLVNLLNPIACRGTSELLVHTGTLGALLAVPVFFTATAVSRSLVSTIAVVNLFITAPMLVLQARPGFLEQTANVLRDEEMHHPLMSVEFVGSKILGTLSPDLKEYAGLFLLGTNQPELNRRRFAPLQTYYLVLGEYAYARERAGRGLLREYLQSRPETFAFLLAIKHYRSGLLITDRLLADAGEIAGELFGQTGDEVYLLVIRLVEELDRGTRWFTSSEEELSATLAWLDYLKYPGSPPPPDTIRELAEAVLGRLESFPGE